MTEEQAKRLKPGDVVDYLPWGRHVWQKASVTAVLPGRYGCQLQLQPLGKTRSGRRFQKAFADPQRVRPPVAVEVLTANVCADWLDDHDFPEAAAALRRAFPLGQPAAIPSTA